MDEVVDPGQVHQFANHARYHHVSNRFVTFFAPEIDLVQFTFFPRSTLAPANYLKSIAQPRGRRCEHPACRAPPPPAAAVAALDSGLI